MSMLNSRLLPVCGRALVALVCLLAACSDMEPQAALPDLATPSPPPPPQYAMAVKIPFRDDGMGAPFFTQNGSTVHIARADMVGKTVYYVVVEGGKSVANAKPLEIGQTTVAADLSAMFTTATQYADGFWELAIVVSLTGSDITKGPQPGDLAGFDLTPPPAGEPPVTGVSIRVHIKDADAMVKLDNLNFIRF
jgi:hypothetical protein